MIPISKMFVTGISQNIGDKLEKSNAESTPSRRESIPNPILLRTNTRDRERIGKIFVIFFLLATVDIELTSEYFRDYLSKIKPKIERSDSQYAVLL